LKRNEKGGWNGKEVRKQLKKGTSPISGKEAKFYRNE